MAPRIERPTAEERNRRDHEFRKAYKQQLLASGYCTKPIVWGRQLTPAEKAAREALMSGAPVPEPLAAKPTASDAESVPAVDHASPDSGMFISPSPRSASPNATAPKRKFSDFSGGESVPSTRRSSNASNDPASTTLEKSDAGVFSLPKIKKKNRPAIPVKASAGPSLQRDTGGTRSLDISSPIEDDTNHSSTMPARDELPGWYMRISPNSVQWDEKAIRLRRIVELMDDCAETFVKTRRQPSKEQVDAVRQELHFIEMKFKVDARILRKTRMLHADKGLKRIFDCSAAQCVEYPWDVKADAMELHNKWLQRMFDPDLYIGIARKEKSKSFSIQANYPHKQDCNYFGNHLLVNGQWFPSQLCALRDGAHGSAQGGISGKKGVGAHSVVLAGGHYQDRDEGDNIWYCGTDATTNYEVTENTKLLVANVGQQNKPVRVLRSQNLPATNVYKPERGYRYDGLYDVLDFNVLDERKQIHLFHLRRQGGQAPIRYQGLEKRPTKEEIVAYDELRKKLGLDGGIS
ncbi:hypothetical protein LTS18_013797 [Coniosporium uncinatum]|uniref:Uncharacterized protein n=1 Tax=Coniosporium uncinatum TaxID=93489 RepID=A0ACC3D8P5_9PEZI|nr:hypothetical protein LTS18_013797 [Coniosporium uncinatum]